MLSFLNRVPHARQISCGITHTNERTHEIVRANLGRSAMYGGHIEGVGPRYCPSIEDKVVRFADKTSHQVFLEPEGLDDHTVYPNGISTSLPADVQLAYVRTIKGLEDVEILQPGYAIEYDYFDPRRVGPWPGNRAYRGCSLPDRSTGPRAMRRRRRRACGGAECGRLAPWAGSRCVSAGRTAISAS